jgi:hypothetical protein
MALDPRYAKADRDGVPLRVGDRVRVMDFKILEESKVLSPYGTVTEFSSSFIYIDRDDGNERQGYLPSSLIVIRQPDCPQCEEGFTLEDDYLCEECRYGV